MSVKMLVVAGGIIEKDGTLTPIIYERPQPGNLAPEPEKE